MSAALHHVVAGVSSRKCPFLEQGQGSNCDKDA